MVGIRIHSGISALHATVNPEELQRTLGESGSPGRQWHTVDTCLPHTSVGLVSDALSQKERSTHRGYLAFSFWKVVSLNKKPNVRAHTGLALSLAEH